MIKYEIKTGAKHLNEVARSHRDLLKRDLKGMYCGKCNEDSVIRFVPFENHIKPEFDICCEDFKKRIDAKRWPSK